MAPARADDFDRWLEERAAAHERRLRRRFARLGAVLVPVLLLGAVPDDAEARPSVPVVE